MSPRRPLRSVLLCLALCSCACAARSSVVTRFQNETGDPELEALALSALPEQLKANGIDPTEFALDVRLDEPEEGALRIQILCSTRADHLLKARALVTGRGTRPRRLIASMISRAASDLAPDCR